MMDFVGTVLWWMVSSMGCVMGVWGLFFIPFFPRSKQSAAAILLREATVMASKFFFQPGRNSDMKNVLF